MYFSMLCTNISTEENIELSAIFVISFVDVLVNFNNTSKTQMYDINENHLFLA